MTTSAPQKVVAVTVVTTPAYVIGGMVLGYSLKKQQWKQATAVLVSREISAADRARLATLWQEVIEVEHIPNPHPEQELGLPSFAECFTKLRVWQLTDFDRVLYIDADAVALGPLDDLPLNTDFAAAPCSTSSDQFCSAVMVLKPSQETFQKLTSLIGTLPSYDGSDQGFLNSYYADWFTGPAERRLPFRYCMPRILAFYHPSWNRFIAQKGILHYFGPNKPWTMASWIAGYLIALVAPSRAPRPSPQKIWSDLRREMESDVKQWRSSSRAPAHPPLRSES